VVRARRSRAAVSLAAAWSVCAVPAARAAPSVADSWPGDDMPLPITVRTPEELAFKNEAERQYAVFNLMTSGKLAFEAGDYARALRRWEALLKLPSLPPDVERAVLPLYEAARVAAGGAPSAVPLAATVLPPSRSERSPRSEKIAPPEPPRVPELGNVTGTVLGGGAVGPGGAVLWLKRLDGRAPPVRPLRKPKVVSQKDKTFIPRVVVVTVGSRVDFRNDDDFYHNVFSLSDAEKFDTGLYAGGLLYTQTFSKPGPVELLCNIHASMVGYVVAVDTPYYTQPRTNGTFVLRNIPPGRYELSTWHEASTRTVKQTVEVGEGGARGITVKIPTDRVPLVVVPDKYGKPRQPQLGY
jgi:plastocyanin